MPLRRRRIFRHCQVVFTTAAVLTIAALIFGLGWVNQNGFSGQWAEKVAAELAGRGIHAEFQSVRFSPLRGLIAKGVIIYQDETRSGVFADIPSLDLDIDRSAAMRGELVLRKLILSETTLTLPLPTDGETSRALALEEVSGKFSIDRQGRLLVESGRCTIGGVAFALRAELDQFDLATLTAPSSPDEGTGGTNFLNAIYTELDRWQFPETQPPLVSLDIHGSCQPPSSIRTSFSLDAVELTRNTYAMESVLLAGELRGRQLVVDHFEFSDGAGLLEGFADYDLTDQEGRYNLESGIHLSRMLRTCFAVGILDELISVEAPEIKAHGEFRRGDDGAFHTIAIGRLDLPPFQFRRQSFERLHTDFSWQDGDLFLRDLSVHDANGSLEGDVLIKNDDIRYQARSTLSPDSYDLFIEKDSGLEQIIARASFKKDSRITIAAEGWIQRSQLKNWSASGTAALEQLAFNGSALKEASAEFSMDSKGSSFKNIKALFDYREYPLHKRHGGVAEALVEADEVSYSREAHETKIANLRGTAWPGPVLRLFTPRTANYIEKTYRTRKPPMFSAAGVVDDNRKNSHTDVKASIKIPGLTDYNFLGKELHLGDASFRLRVRQGQVDITGLSFGTFQGTGGGELTVFNPPGTPVRFKGGLKWTRLHLARIGQTYGFEKASQGLVTGRFDFRGTGESVRSLNGHGSIGLENGHLFYVPVLGPLSAPLGEILGNKRASHEEARNASCSFAVTKGVFQTRDFITTTPNSVFTGEGDIDLNRRIIDMTIRMNARGLLGLITLPLRPFNGLFQFRGTGPLHKPTWRNSSFTTPPDGKNDPIFRKPSKAQIVPDP